MNSYRYVFVDVFTDRPLSGNQLAVFTDAREIPEELLQPIAREINFSETVYVYPAGKEADARIRIFTPLSELRFAGHPILGTAFVLAAPMQLVELRLQTDAGVVPVRLERDGNRIVFGRMVQPVPAISMFEETAPFFAVLGVPRATLPVELYDNGVLHLLVALQDRAAVAALDPDFAGLVNVARDSGTPTVCVSCFAGDSRHWKTRMFAPTLGVSEDPATGSAAGPIACHLSRHGLIEFGDEIEISQGEELGRPSTLYARAQGTSEEIQSVEVGGSAQIIARGELRV